MLDDIIYEVNWVWVAIVYSMVLIAIWKLALFGTSEDSASALIKLKIIFTIAMLPICILIVYKMGDE